MGFKKAKITTTLVDALKAGETVMDTELPGYLVRRQQGDARIYAVRKHANGKRHFETIGEHGREGWTEVRARRKALDIISALRNGLDPAAERIKLKAVPTVAEWADTFFETHGPALKPKTLADYRGILRNHVAPRDAGGRLTSDCLGRRRMDQITREHVRALHLKLKNKPRTANYMLAFIGVMFSEACGVGGCLPESHTNPARRIKKFPERQRERFLTTEELDRLGSALAAAEESEDPFALAAVRLLIFTGARLSEILTLRWTDVELAQAALRLQNNKTATTTRGSIMKIKTIHLSEPALEVIANLPRIHGNPFVIVGKKEGRHWVNLRKLWVRLLQAAAIEPVTLPDGKLEAMRLHDLRHSYASVVAASGASLLMIGKLLGHTNPQTTARYAHLVDDPLKQHNNAAGQRFAAALGSKG
jgi:integrase